MFVIVELYYYIFFNEHRVLKDAFKQLQIPNNVSHLMYLMCRNIKGGLIATLQFGHIYLPSTASLMMALVDAHINSPGVSSSQ